MVLYPVVDKTTWDLLQVRWRLKVFDISYGVRCSLFGDSHAACGQRTMIGEYTRMYGEICVEENKNKNKQRPFTHKVSSMACQFVSS